MFSEIGFSHAAHRLLSSGLATVNALSQSIFEHRRPEKRSTNRFTPATAVEHACQKIETKNENVSSEKPVFGLKKRCRRVVDIEFLIEIERKHAQWTPHAMAP